MTYGEHARAPSARWEDLDALVLEEMEALGGRSRDRRGVPAPPSAQDPGRDPSALYGDLAQADGDDEADEESFIERTVDYLRERPDADALLEAIRATLYDQEPEPLDVGDQAVDAGAAPEDGEAADDSEPAVAADVPAAAELGDSP
jgi:hypothetical protein